ncbi:MAG: hypothetical protein B7733_01310 [Myxococcales bacterium FL481]|nr:MAG: hypothetical protein B7733_01310 [Myxococcales bacterium FL481]
MRHLSPYLVASLSLACGADPVIYEHRDPDAGNVAAGLDPDDSSFECAAAPPGHSLMPDLAVGWAVSEPNETRLQLGTHMFSCAGTLGSKIAHATACPDLWAFELAVPDAVFALGTHVIGPEYGGTLIEFTRSPNGEGCARTTVHSTQHAFGGILVLRAIEEQCVVGEFVDLTFPTNIPDLSGTFVAQRC